MYVKFSVRRRVLVAVGVGLGGWLAMNLLSAYGATNPWMTELLWRPESQDGALRAAVPGRSIETDTVIGHYAAPTTDRGVVVLVHGYGGDRNAAPVVTASSWLHDEGYGVLALDLGYLHGRHRYSAGPREAGDISAAIDWLESEGLDLSAVWGFSAGAHASLRAAATDARIPVVVADSAFVDGARQIGRIAGQTWHLPPVAFPLVAGGVRLFSGDWPVDLRNDPWPPTPVLVVHGTEDQAVPVEDAEEICRHTRCEMLQLADVGHTGAHEAAARDYRAAALAFIEDHTITP